MLFVTLTYHYILRIPIYLFECWCTWSYVVMCIIVMWCFALSCWKNNCVCILVVRVFCRLWSKIPPLCRSRRVLYYRFGKQTASQKRIPSSSIIPTVDSYHSYVSCKVASWVFGIHLLPKLHKKGYGSFPKTFDVQSYWFWEALCFPK